MNDLKLYVSPAAAWAAKCLKQWHLLCVFMFYYNWEHVDVSVAAALHGNKSCVMQSTRLTLISLSFSQRTHTSSWCRLRASCWGTMWGPSARWSDCTPTKTARSTGRVSDSSLWASLSLSYIHCGPTALHFSSTVFPSCLQLCLSFLKIIQRAKDPDQNITWGACMYQHALHMTGSPLILKVLKALKFSFWYSWFKNVFKMSGIVGVMALNLIWVKLYLFSLSIIYNYYYIFWLFYMTNQSTY